MEAVIQEPIVCRQCRKEVKTEVYRCLPCDRCFHPSCYRQHKVHNASNELVPCKGKMETYIIKKTYEGCVPVRESDKERELLEDGRMLGSSMVGRVDNIDEHMDQNLLTAESLLDSKIDNMYKLMKEIKDEIIGKEVIRKVIYEELDKVRQEIQHRKTTELKLIVSEVVKKEIQEVRNIVPRSSTELGVVNTGTYSGAVKNERESVIIIKPRQEEEGKSSEATKRDIKNKIDISKLEVGITKMKRITRGAVVIAYENKTQAKS